MTPIEEVISSFVSPLFPDFVAPVRLYCPSDVLEQELLDAMYVALNLKKFVLEVVNLRSDAETKLGEVTAQLSSLAYEQIEGGAPPSSVIAMLGLEMLEGQSRDAPIYPFRSRLQFDRKHLWMFIGRDRTRFNRLFCSARLPLYRAARDITPPAWRFA